MPKKVEISNVFQPHLSKEKPKITNIFPLHSYKRDFWVGYTFKFDSS